MTSFVGRGRELAQVGRLLANTRLLTVTGVGGVGKTRLMLRAAGRARSRFPGGVWFVDLSDLPHPKPFTRMDDNAELLACLATGLRVQDRGDVLGVQQVADHVGGRRMLLLLDSCEHVAPACAQLVDRLLRACAGLRILVGSREPLGVPGEVIFSVSPLSVPEPGRRHPVDAARSESVALFTARAQAVEPRFEVNAGNRAAVAEICRRLEGLPLAIELAAARVRVMTPQAIVDRLADRSALLDQTGGDVPQRQRTLRACMEWSFSLCDKSQQVLWARLSVFVGGFELDAVEGVCADETLPVEDLLDLVTDLLDKSILVHDPAWDGQSEQARYRMLETIRDFGQQQLRETGEYDLLRRRHRDWHQRLVAYANAEWISDRQEYWLARLSREHPNLRAAIDYCLAEPDQADAALHIAATLPMMYRWTGGLFTECRQWLERALAKATEPTALRARALLLEGQMAITQNQNEIGIRLVDEGESLAGQLNATLELALAVFIRAQAHLQQGELTAAIEFGERSRTILSTLPEPQAGLELELRLSQLNLLGLAAGLAGDQQRADACLYDLLGFTKRRGECRYRLYALWGLALSAWRQGKVHETMRPLVANLEVRQDQNPADPFGIAQCIEAAAWVAADRGRYRRAATLLGGADALWTEATTSIGRQHDLIDDHDTCERKTRAALGDKAFTDAFTQGRALSYVDTIAYALHEHR